MKLVRMFGLAVIAATASMAFIGASSAMAEFPTVLCGEHPPGLETCKTPITGHVEGLSTHALLSASGITIKCTHSKILGEALGLAAAGVRMIGHVSELTFTGCSGGTVTVIDKTGLLLLLKTALNLGDVEAHGFEVLVESFGLHCVYGGVAKLHAEGSTATALAKITASGAILKEQGAHLVFCPETSKWTATYTVQLPHKIFIAS
jgi:hypothetical protein